MSDQPTYRAAVIGLGFVGAGDQVSGDAIGQCVRDLDGTHAPALAAHPRVELVAGASRDGGRTFHRWPDALIPRDAPEERDGNRSNYMVQGVIRGNDRQ